MDVKQTLDRLIPETGKLPYWDAVVRDARASRVRWAVPRVAVVCLVLAAAGLFAVAPWRTGESAGLLDRALAAIGDEPIMHVVFRGDWGGTLVDLKTGERKPLYGEQEIWYDASRNRAHEISRFGGAVESEEIYSPEKKASPYAVLARDYRKALAEGTARIAGKDTFDGTSVYWITIRRLMLPDVADGRNHEFAEEVAVSTETFKPVAIRALRDRRAFSTERVIELETVAADEADFSADPEASLDGRAMMAGSDPIPLDRAAALLGRTPLWLGPTFAGLPLARTEKAFSRTGSPPVRHLVTGARADRIRDCLRERPRGRCPEHMGAIVQRDDRIYELGRPTFGPMHTGLTLFYGIVGDNPGTFRKEDDAPQMSQPHVLVTQTDDSELISLTARQMNFRPPNGSVVITPGGSGYLVRDGLYVSIRAANEEQVLAAAKALRPMASGESGAGE